MNLFNKGQWNQTLPGTQDSGVTSLDVTIPGARIPVFNSTTYVDLLGLFVGLSRIPGETSFEFGERVAKAATVSRSADYAGIMNELGLQLGLDLEEAIALTGPAGYTVRVDIAGVHLVWPSNEVAQIPLLRIAVDNFWEWRLLSDVVSDINTLSGFTATLLITDGPALQMVQQSNVLLAVAEDIAGDTVRLAHTGLLAGSEQFNQPTPDYTIEGSVVTFVSAVAAGTKVNYNYRLDNYRLLASPICLISLVDPLLATIGVGPKNKLVYQMKEFVQELVTRDRSYWAV